MSSTDPDKPLPDSEHGADTTDLPFFGPPTARALCAQLRALVAEKKKQKPFVEAALIKIQQDRKAAFANDADLPTLFHHFELEKAQLILSAQFHKDYSELLKQCTYVCRELAAHRKRMKQDLAEARKWISEAEARTKEAKKRTAVHRRRLIVAEVELEATRIEANVYRALLKAERRKYRYKILKRYLHRWLAADS